VKLPKITIVQFPKIMVAKTLFYVRITVSADIITSWQC